jgi:hypothetical protein
MNSIHKLPVLVTQVVMLPLECFHLRPATPILVDHLACPTQHRQLLRVGFVRGYLKDRPWRISHPRHFSVNQLPFVYATEKVQSPNDERLREKGAIGARIFKKRIYEGS